MCASAFAQPHIRTPQASPRAVIEETFGITDVRVSYHRPSTNGRHIFGGLVPYDVIWRAGANDPTTITFSTPVKIEGKEVAPGTYSFFYIPGRDQWTFVLNRFTGGWGTYSYDASEDVLRAKVTPQPAEMQERLAYSFDEGKKDEITLAMRWEKTRVPVKIAAETQSLVAEGIKNRLRSEMHWDAQAWTEAASWTLGAGNLDLALTYADQAIEMSPNAQALRLKARIIEKKGDAAGAKALRARAETLMSPEIAPINAAYALIGQKKYDDAITSLGDTKSWRGLSAIGDAWAAKGDKTKAMEFYDKAMAAAQNQSDKTEVQDSINALGAGA
jgi:hypothetical protein